MTNQVYSEAKMKAIQWFILLLLLHNIEACIPGVPINEFMSYGISVDKPFLGM